MVETIRVLKREIFVDGKYYEEMAGLSTDTKPTAGIITGSRFKEMDTGDTYAYDETGTGSWYKVG